MLAHRTDFGTVDVIDRRPLDELVTHRHSGALTRLLIARLLIALHRVAIQCIGLLIAAHWISVRAIGLLRASHRFVIHSVFSLHSESMLFYPAGRQDPHLNKMPARLGPT